MASRRRVNWISQQRVDVPDMRAVESAVSNDFDELIKSFLTGTSQGYIVRGFEISMAGAIGGAASGLQMLVDPGALLHINSTQSGTFFLVPTGTPAQQLNSATNTIVDGAFSPSAINYVGIEYERYVDDTTSSQVYLWNPTTNNETTKNAPRAQLLRYRIKISTSTPGSNVLPICKVTTDSGNNVVDITDARWLLGRLGQGGFNPNPFYQYPWTSHTEGRTENPSTSSSNGVNPFRGGDKQISNLKEWMDAVMTSIKEVVGGTYWYSENASGSLASLRQDLGNTVITGRGHIAHSADTAGLLNWDEDIVIRVVGSRLSYTLAANDASTDITLSEEEVAYITLVRDVDVVPNLIFTNGSAVVTSVGNVAWTSALQAGDFIKLAADTVVGYYKITSVDSASQVTLTQVFAGTSTGAPGAKAKYAFGTYQTSPTPSTDRHIYIADREDVPTGENVFWLYLRTDNGGSIPRIYVRFLGSEIEQGETEEISDTTSKQLLMYIGSPMESASRPLYVSALNAGSVAQIQDITFGNAATISNNQYFLLNSSGDWRKYYVWFNKNAAGVDPTPAGRSPGIEVAITTGMTAPQVAAAVAAAMGTTDADDFTAFVKAVPNNDTVRVTNTSAGTCVAAVNFNVGAPFTVVVVQSGTGTGNRAIIDGDSLTLSIKKLDESLADFAAALDSPGYDEVLAIAAPTAAGTLLTLPLNSRLSNAPQLYSVGKGILQICLNGQRLMYGEHFDEVGSVGDFSDQVQILCDLVVGDDVKFELISLGGPGTGGGAQGPQGNPGNPGPPGSDAIGGPIAISSKSANYTVLLTDNVILADCSGGNVILSLPTAASSVGRIYFFKKIDPTANAMIIQANGAELIDNANTQQSVTQYESLTIACDGTKFWIL